MTRADLASIRDGDLAFCPACKGEGTVVTYDWTEVRCEDCGGQGWVFADDEMEAA